MKQAIWRGKEIRKEQSDGILEFIWFTNGHLQSFVFTVFTRERLPDGMAYARTQWSVTPVPFLISGAKGKRKKPNPSIWV